MNIDPKIEEFLEKHFSENKEFLDALVNEIEPYGCHYHLSKFKNGALGFTNDDKNVYLSDILVDESKYDRFMLVFTLLHETRHTAQEVDFNVENFEVFAKDVQGHEDDANDFAFEVLRKLSKFGYEKEIQGIITELSNFLANLVKSGFLKIISKEYFEMKSDYEIDDIIEL